MGKKMNVATYVALMLLLFVPAVSGQTSKGFVVGNITDPNGASVPNATVKATNSATGVARDTTVQDDGSYRFDAIDPGNYKIEATAPGFKTGIRDVVVNAVVILDMFAQAVPFAIDEGLEELRTIFGQRP